jgi:hypothetical protein
MEIVRAFRQAGERARGCRFARDRMRCTFEKAVYGAFPQAQYPRPLHRGRGGYRRHSGTRARTWTDQTIASNARPIVLRPKTVENYIEVKNMSNTGVPPRESMEFDVVIVGAGPAGLAAAIRVKQLLPDATVIVVEKGSEVGAHILSGAVIDPVGIDKLLPEWRKESDTLIKTPVTDDRFFWLFEKSAIRVPNFLMPPLMSNHGNFIVSLGNVCRWLAKKSRSFERRDLSWLRGGGTSARRQGRGQGHRDRRRGNLEGRRAAGNTRYSLRACAVRSLSS